MDLKSRGEVGQSNEKRQLVEQFRLEFDKLFAEWKSKWQNPDSGPIPESGFIKSAFDPNFHDKDAEEFEARDRLVDFVAEYIINSSDPNIIIDSLPMVFGAQIKAVYPEFIGKVIKKILELKK
jgi:hypothetical protein